MAIIFLQRNISRPTDFVEYPENSNRVVHPFPMDSKLRDRRPQSLHLEPSRVPLRTYLRHDGQVPDPQPALLDLPRRGLLRAVRLGRRTLPGIDPQHGLGQDEAVQGQGRQLQNLVLDSGRGFQSGERQIGERLDAVGFQYAAETSGV